jgi:hypothetical protein
VVDPGLPWETRSLLARGLDEISTPVMASLLRHWSSGYVLDEWEAGGHPEWLM